ncbi:Endoribonuclease YbeY, partial [Geodia barretti]
MRGMPVWLKNLQSSVRFGEHLLRLQTNFILGLAGAGRYDVSVVCVESESIRNLNRVYRNVDRATDVLAFPYHEDTEPGALPPVQEEREEDYNLGDVILGISVIREECEREGVKLGHRLPVIFTHGLCHLLGYRHSTPSLTEQVSSLSLVSNSCLFSFQSLP